jgi:hypothetical protein
VVVARAPGADEAALDDADAVLARAGALLLEAGLVATLESSERALFVRVCADAAEAARFHARAEAALAAWRAFVAARPHAHAGVAAHAAGVTGEVLVRAGHVEGGPLFTALERAAGLTSPGTPSA